MGCRLLLNFTLKQTRKNTSTVTDKKNKLKQPWQTLWVEQSTSLNRSFVFLKQLGLNQNS